MISKASGFRGLFLWRLTNLVAVDAIVRPCKRTAYEYCPAHYRRFLVRIRPELAGGAMHSLLSGSRPPVRSVYISSCRRPPRRDRDASCRGYTLAPTVCNGSHGQAEGRSFLGSFSTSTVSFDRFHLGRFGCLLRQTFRILIGLCFRSVANG